MIRSEIKFETGFGKSGAEYGHIQAYGNIRNILVAIITYFNHTKQGVIDSHLGSDIKLKDYPIRISYGKKGGEERKDYLGFVFDGGSHWYGDIDEWGNSESRERLLTMENKKGIQKIITDILGENGIKDIWNHEKASTSFSVVLNVPVKWTIEENRDKFVEQTTTMVKGLNSLANALNAVTRI